MITFEQAREIAKKEMPQATHYSEFGKGWMFSIPDNEDIGGGNSPLIVLKEDGQAVSLIHFIEVIGTGGLIREDIEL